MKKFLHGNFFVFAPGSTCEGIESCSLYSLYACAEFNLPASINKIIDNALGNQTNNSNPTSITFNQNYVVNPNRLFILYSSLTNHTLMIHVPASLLNACCNSSLWIVKLGTTNVSKMIVSI
ncbi:MAG: hypothetical protein LBS76_00905 [Mycoplasmataceae bacterium]|jgi:hypothetical protein|nr:hypothetical protein [Mycoplasmataceae bacterium]